MERTAYVDVFIEEAKENLQTVNTTLLAIEETGFDEGLMNNAFRALHTIKGTAAVVGVEPIAEVTHALEDLADRLRNGHCAPDRECMDILFKGADTIELMVDQLEMNGEVTESARELLSRIKDKLSSMGDQRKDSADDGSNGEECSETNASPAMEADPIVTEIEVTFQDNAVLREVRAFQVQRALMNLGSVLRTEPCLGEIDDNVSAVRFILSSKSVPNGWTDEIKGITGIAEVRHKVVDIPQARDGSSDHFREVERSEKGPVPSSSTIRVKSKLLDQLLDLVGEIMINNIRINQISNDLKNRELKQTLQNNARLMGELQDIVLRTRMVEVDFIFKRFPRMVRDLATNLGKQVDFVIKGNDIEIDRALLDGIGEALVHLLRNAVDHGIEPKEVREAAGKDPVGKVVLTAYREQSNVVITVEDDGRGIDSRRLIQKALEKGLISEEQAMTMDERSALNLIFLPGFSTAEKVSDVSGRGVGMDVVRTKIEGMGGFIRLESTPGKGSKITLKLPPSMSIIRAMLVEINGEKYAIPLENVRETVKVSSASIYEVANKCVFRLREDILPVFNVPAEFGQQRELARQMPAIIVERNDNRACLIVSRLIGQQEIVVKGLGKDLRTNGYFSGATILGDGKVAMILDVGAFI